MTDHTDLPAAEPPAPPLTQRRSRVREVSSRFMSPLIQPNSSSPNQRDYPRSKSVQRRRTDENHVPDTNRSLDKCLVFGVSAVQRKQQPQRAKQQCKENGDDHQLSNVRVSSRPDTPISIGTDRIVQSRYRQVFNSVNRSNSLSSSSNGCTPVSAAARLLQEATSDVEKKLSKISISRDGSDHQSSSSCPNSPLCMPMSKLRGGPDTWSSMPDVDKWIAERIPSNAGKIQSDCARSLNFSSSVKVGGGTSLPPHPSFSIKSGIDARKGKKISNHLGDLHSLKILSNHHLQWRWANSKAEAAAHVQQQEAEKKLYSLGCKISNIREDVQRKRNELSALRGIQTLNSIVEAQMPHLDEWSTMEEDYSISLSGITNALLRSSARLPVSGEVRADIDELENAMSSAYKVVESIGSRIQIFMEKAEEMDGSISELARMVGEERVHIEECGDLLAKTQKSQVEECSLRGTFIQLYHINHQSMQKKAQ
ncbi:QWRF motif-containing protein 7-like [Dorcoceras hygrometricum]|uniref:QWRF motif-containing protein 7-like n=1 Tax=Dorcoceras hygrometricum TaxID=472368 RepID=A0A2Z7AXY5_9LAMI|nr:QWRF motif-containing protein 7-like [Dorcoceras hygrometricum]